jgi:hypothetical protein
VLRTGRFRGGREPNRSAVPEEQRHSKFLFQVEDRLTNAGDFYLEESGFCLMPTKAEIEKMMAEGEGYFWLKEVRPMWPFQ